MSLWMIMIKIASCVRYDNDTDTDTRSPAGSRKQTPTPDTISGHAARGSRNSFPWPSIIPAESRNMQCLDHQLDKIMQIFNSG